MLHLKRLLVVTIGRVRSQNIPDFAMKLLRRHSFLNASRIIYRDEEPFLAVRPQAQVREAFGRNFELESSVLLF